MSAYLSQEWDMDHPNGGWLEQWMTFLPFHRLVVWDIVDLVPRGFWG